MTLITFLTVRRAVSIAVIASVLLMLSLRGGVVLATTGAVFSGWYDFGLVPPQGVPCATAPTDVTMARGSGIFIVCTTQGFPFHGY